MGEEGRHFEKEKNNVSNSKKHSGCCHFHPRSVQPSFSKSFQPHMSVRFRGGGRGRVLGRSGGWQSSQQQQPTSSRGRGRGGKGTGLTPQQQPPTSSRGRGRGGKGTGRTPQQQPPSISPDPDSEDDTATTERLMSSTPPFFNSSLDPRLRQQAPQQSPSSAQLERSPSIPPRQAATRARSVSTSPQPRRRARTHSPPAYHQASPSGTPEAYDRYERQSNSADRAERHRRSHSRSHSRSRSRSRSHSRSRSRSWSRSRS